MNSRISLSFFRLVRNLASNSGVWSSDPSRIGDYMRYVNVCMVTDWVAGFSKELAVELRGDILQKEERAS